MSQSANTTPQATNLPGYQIHKIIGTGGMGKVYQALDERLQRKVAIKVLNPIPGDSTSAKAFAEARAMARVNHSNVVQIYDVVAQDGQVALIMEYLQGETLASFQRQQLLSLEQKLTILHQTCNGVAAIHDAGLVHADIKANNIWITDQLTVKVLDLGISQPTSGDLPTSQNTSHEVSFGSLNTMSPEQLKGDAIGHKSDIFSLGVLAFQLFAGRSPFQTQIATTQDPQETPLQKVDRNQSTEDAGHIYPPLPPALSNLLNEMLSVDKEKRPVSITAVSNRIVQIKNDLLSAVAMEQLTAPLEKTDVNIQASKNPTLVKSLTGLSASSVIVFLLAVLTITALIRFKPWDTGSSSITQPQQYNERFVAVLRPTLTATTKVDKSKLDLIVATVDDAVRQTILDAKTLHLLSRQETNIAKGSIREIGKALAATDIITTNIECSEESCEIRLDRITNENWSVVEQKQWFISNDTTFNMYQEIRSLLAKMITQDSSKGTNTLTELGSFELNISPDSYDSFAKLYAKIVVAGEHNLKTLSELEHFILNNSSMEQAYELYRWLALKLYDDRKDSTITLSFQNLLDSAPATYQGSVFFAIKRFWLALYQGDIQSAKHAIDLAQIREANQYQLLEMQAAYHLQNNEPEVASEYYKQLLSRRFNQKHLFNLAICYWYMGESEEAETTLNNLLNIQSKHYPANQLLASINLLQGDISEAIDAYKRLTIDNAYSMDLNNLAVAYMLQRNYQKAKALLIRAIEQSPNNPSLHLNLADAFTLNGEIEQGKTYYKNVIAYYADSQELNGQLEKAQAHAHLGQFREAIKTLNLANKMAPGNEEVAFVSALVYQLLNEPLFALAKAEEAMQAGMGYIWFTLPWFDSLCNEPAYRKLFKENNNSHCIPIHP